MKTKLKSAVEAIDDAIASIKAIGTGRKTDAMVRKLILVKAELSAELEKSRVMSEIPVREKIIEA